MALGYRTIFTRVAENVHMNENQYVFILSWSEQAGGFMTWKKYLEQRYPVSVHFLPCSAIVSKIASLCHGGFDLGRTIKDAAPGVAGI